MYEIQVTRMNCGGCAAAIKRAIHGIDSSAGITVDLAKKTVRVETQAGLNAVSSAIKEAGYPILKAELV